VIYGRAETVVIKITPEFIQKGDCSGLIIMSFYIRQKMEKDATT